MTANEFARIADQVFGPFAAAKRLIPREVESPRGYLRRYDGPDVYLNVSWDHARTRELAFTLGRHSDEQNDLAGLQTIDVSAAVRSCGARFDRRSDYPTMASTSSDLHASFRRVAELLNEYAEPFFDGQDAPWRTVRAELIAKASAYTDGTAARQAASKAEPAWRDKEYARVVEILEPVADALDSTTRRRLDFARARLSSEPQTRVWPD